MNAFVRHKEEGERSGGGRRGGKGGEGAGDADVEVVEHEGTAVAGRLKDVLIKSGSYIGYMWCFCCGTG